MPSSVAANSSWKGRLRSSGAAPVALELPTRKRSKRQQLPPPYVSNCEKVFSNADSTRAIMGFLGSCEFLFVGGVSRGWKRTYTSYCEEAHEEEDEVGAEWMPLTSQKAAIGSLSRLEYAVASGLDLSSPFFMDAAGKYGEKEALLWARARGMKWDAELCRGAAWSGRLSHLIWLREKSCPWIKDSIVHAAASRGHVDILEYLWEQFPELEGSSARWIVQAVVSHHDRCRNPMGVLDFARRHMRFLLGGTGWPDIYHDAGRTSREVIEWLHNIGFTPLRKAICNAMRNGKLDVVQFLLQHDDPRLADETRQGYPFDLSIKFAVKDTAKNGHAHVLSWLYDQRRITASAIEEVVFPYVMKKGHVALAKWLHDINIPQGTWSTSTLEDMLKVACLRGHVELMQWLRQLGVRWPSAMWQLEEDEETGICGHIDLWSLKCVKWAVSAGCPWGEWPDKARNALHDLVLAGDPKAKKWVKWTSERGCPCV